MADADFSNYIGQAESKYNLPPGMLSQLLQTESSFDPRAVNQSTGATGIAQVLPSTARDPGYGIKAFDPTNVAASIDFAGHYLKALKDQTGSWENALRHYGTLAGRAGMSYDVAPQNPNQALLLSLARHGDQGPSQPPVATPSLMRSAPDPSQPAAQAVAVPSAAYAGLPPLSDVVSAGQRALTSGEQAIANQVYAMTGWHPGTTPSWMPQWLKDVSDWNNRQQDKDYQELNANLPQRYQISPEQWGMLMGMAGPIEAWHGTGADFKAFAPGFEGTGEGSALYGRAPGGYHAEAQDTAVSYQEQLKGQLLKTQINAEPEDFLHWNEPLSDQPKDIRDMMRDFAPTTPKDMKAARAEYKAASDAYRANPNDPAAREAYESARRDFDLYDGILSGQATGEDIYRYLMDDSGETDPVAQQDYATQQLQELGLPGIRYYDDFLHYPGEEGPKSHGYAVFDPSLVDILKRYGWKPGGQ